MTCFSISKPRSQSLGILLGQGQVDLVQRLQIGQLELDIGLESNGRIDLKRIVRLEVAAGDLGQGPVRPPDPGRPHQGPERVGHGGDSRQTPVGKIRLGVQASFFAVLTEIRIIL